MTLDPVLPVLGHPVPGGQGSAGPASGDPGRADPGPVDAVAWARASVARQWRDRRALERRLHDGAALRVSALTLRLGLLRHARAQGDSEFDAAVEALQDELHLVLQDLRDVEGRLYPPLLDEAGLGPALREAAGRCPVPVHVDAPDERFGPAAEGAAYFALLGCLPRPAGCGDSADAVAVDGVAVDGAADGPDGVVDGARDGVLDGSGRGGAVDVVVRREADDLVMLVTGVAACHAGAVDDGVRLLGGTVVVGDAGSPGAAGAPITVRIPCA